MILPCSDWVFLRSSDFSTDIFPRKGSIKYRLQNKSMVNPHPGNLVSQNPLSDVN